MFPPSLIDIYIYIHHCVEGFWLRNPQLRLADKLWITPIPMEQRHHPIDFAQLPGPEEAWDSGTGGVCDKMWQDWQVLSSLACPELSWLSVIDREHMCLKRAENWDGKSSVMLGRNLKLMDMPESAFGKGGAIAHSTHMYHYVPIQIVVWKLGEAWKIIVICGDTASGKTAVSWAAKTWRLWNFGFFLSIQLRTS